MGKLFGWLFRIIIGILVLLVLALGGLWAYSSLAVRPAPEEPAVAAAANTSVFQAMAAGGIDNAVVDITPERALVRYNLPQGMDEAASWAYALTVLSSVAPYSQQAVVQIYQDFAPKTEVNVGMADVVAMMEGRLTAEQFEQRVRIAPLAASSVK